MTNEQAIQECKRRKLASPILFYDRCIEALKKQVPRKPIPFTCNSGDTPHQAYKCPVCGEEVLEGRGCSNNECRQCIDWSDINE